jgi:hypothetical protein
MAAGLVAAHVPSGAEGIYTCVDAKGHRLTSDRPIIDCIDREQQVLSPQGQVMRKIGPSLTAGERAAEEEKARRAAEERNRLAEEKRRDRALLVRYPDRATHDKERAQAIASIDDVIATANRRIVELGDERRTLETELEFHKGDIAKAPASLKRKIDENEQNVAAQKRFIANQEEEKKRTNARFDEEVVRLKPLWAQAAPAAAVSRSSSSAAR